MEKYKPVAERNGLKGRRMIYSSLYRKNFACDTFRYPFHIQTFERHMNGPRELYYTWANKMINEITSIWQMAHAVYKRLDEVVKGNAQCISDR